jgi:hypothetical protein
MTSWRDRVRRSDMTKITDRRKIRALRVGHALARAHSKPHGVCRLARFCPRWLYRSRGNAL